MGYKTQAFFFFLVAALFSWFVGPFMVKLLKKNLMAAGSKIPEEIFKAFTLFFKGAAVFAVCYAIWMLF